MANAKRTRTVKTPAAKKVIQEAKTLIVKTEKTLLVTAKDINARMEKAKKYADQADDMRLSASLRLAEAKQACDAAKIPFQKWCENHLDFGWQNARKLERIGRGGEDNARAALSDLRQRAAIAQKKSRLKKENKQISGPSPETTKSSKTRLEQFLDAHDGMAEGDRKSFIEDCARNMGLVTIPADSYINLEKVRKDWEKQQADSHFRRAKVAFDALAASDKMKLIAYAAEIIGATLVMPDFGAQNDL
mgnify:CR=1 FL=1|jgi:hypothetical protein|tara:strand:+ start:698 stop:1438 length:741 start_codon:yes stop_codon:yes gene_type:complete